MDKETVTDERWAFGKVMVELREARGVSRAALAQATRIREDFVAALEDGRFECLPGEVFGRGFVRSIAKTLGADSSIVIAQFDRAWGPSTLPHSVLKVEIKNRPSIDRTEDLKVKWLHLTSLARRLFGPRKMVWIASAGIALSFVALIGVDNGRQGLITAWKGRFAKKESVRSSAQSTRSPPAAQTSDEEQDGSGAGSILAEGSARNTNRKVEKSSQSPSVEVREPLKTGSSPSESRQIGTSQGHPFGEGAGSHSSGEPLAFPLKVASDHENFRDKEVQVGKQVLDLVVTDPVRIKFEPDQGPVVVRELKPDTYRFSFGTKADLMVYDAAALKILFNGKSIGSLGNKGRIRRLSFQAEGLKSEKNL